MEVAKDGTGGWWRVGEGLQSAVDGVEVVSVVARSRGAVRIDDVL